MSIIGLQRRLQEVGRIRIGQQVSTSGGKTRPAKLEFFRLTSPDRARIAAAAELYGGQPKSWRNPQGGDEFEVVTATAELAVIVPPGDIAFSQWFELWSGGGCQRRCDGQREILGDQPCLCDPGERECAPHTRLNVMLRDLPGLGVWRLDTQGWNAAQELAATVEVVQAAGAQGRMLPARLRLEQRQRKRPGQQVRRFAVPVLDLDVTFAGAIGAAQLPVGLPVGESAGNGAGQPQFEPVPVDALPAPPAESIADQARAVETPRKRRNTGPELPSTGRRPRTAVEAEAVVVEDEAVPDPPEPEVKRDLTDGQRLAMYCADRGVDDDLRHDVIRLVTGGRAESANDCDPHEANFVRHVADWIRDGALDVVYDPDGRLELQKDDGTFWQPDEVAVGVPSSKAEWVAFANAHGLNGNQLLVRARDIAKGLNSNGDPAEPPPRALDDITPRQATAIVADLAGAAT